MRTWERTLTSRRSDGGFRSAWNDYEEPGTDSLAQAVDYRGVRDKALAAIEGRRSCLIETMARAILDAVASEPRVSRACVRVEKTRALKHARAVTAAVERNRTD